ncbi:MAG: ATP-binding protein [Vicinamibacterales bacterium]
MKPLRLRTRLTLFYSVVLLAVFAVFAATVIWQQARIGLRRVDRELDRLTATVAELLADELSESDTPTQASREVVAALGSAGRVVSIYDAAGQPLAATSGTPALRAPQLSAGEPASEALATSTPDGLWRLGTRRATLASSTFTIVALAPTADTERERSEAVEAMWLAVPVLVLAAAVGGYWLATVALRPITRMASRAAALPADGSDDLGTSGREDELGQLETAFNGLVSRLRTTLQTQRQFMADAAHELRTPVSVIRSVSDVTLDRAERSESEYRDALHTVGVQAQHVGRLLDDMLILARADAGGYPMITQPLYLNEIANECCAALKGVAAASGVDLVVRAGQDVAMVGDEDLLRRMLVNLVQNGLQHTLPGGRVCVNLESTSSVARLEVSDEGTGVPDADRQRIFDRFVQLDPARRRAGAGLGLPISRWIAELHGGRVTLAESSHAGSRFVVDMPLHQGGGETPRPGISN